MERPIFRNTDAPINVGGIMMNEPGMLRADEDYDPAKHDRVDERHEFTDPTAERSAFEGLEIKKPDESEASKEGVPEYKIGEQKFTSKDEFLKEVEKYKGKKDVPEISTTDEDAQKEYTELLKHTDSPSGKVELEPEKELGILNRVFGTNYDSLDQATQELKGLTQKVQSLEKDNQALIKKANENSNPFLEDEEFVRAYHFRKQTGKGLDEFLRIKNFDPENVNPLNLLVEDHLAENPKDDPRLVRRYFEKKHKLTPSHFRSDSKYKDMDDEDFNSQGIQAEIADEIEMNKLELKREVSPIIKKFKEMKDKTNLPDFQKEREQSDSQARIAEATRLSTWDDKIKGKITNFTKYVDAEEGESEPLVEMEVSNSQRSEIEKNIKDYVRKYKIDPTNDEHLKFIDDFIYRSFEHLYKKEIRKHLIEETKRKVDDEYAQRTGTKLTKKNIVSEDKGLMPDYKKQNEEEEKKVMAYHGIRR